jgi:cell division protein FtsB
MKEFKDKRKLKKILYSKFSIVVLLLVFIFVAKAGYNVYKKQADSYENRIGAEKELNELKARQAALASEIERLGTPEGIEEEIREKYKVAKENENMVIIVEEETKAPKVEKKKGFFSGIKEKLKEIFKSGE